MELKGFVRNVIATKYCLKTKPKVGRGESSNTIGVKFVVVDSFSAYNTLLGRSSLNNRGVFVSTREEFLRVCLISVFENCI